MPQAVKCDLFLYADDTCLTFQHENVKEIEDQLNLNFSSLCDWFIDNKLSIHLGEDKTKSILFGTKLNIKQAEPLNIVYGNVKIKQYTKVTRGDSEGGAGGTPPLPYFLQLLVFFLFFFCNHFEALQTVLFEVELIINNATLTHVYPNTIETCLIPNHLLFVIWQTINYYILLTQHQL